ncbi:hypothetical protein CMUS01_12543 [Colletotrichum musicola]|uniref:Uncharacterized protein n=1 Tax=Colletotrichum musicola TaxID=2175873 RepID=A0A8H6N0F3_9PEZI|nr:hypothetical protein CMUS01_12543 [Colletotrichum musicola]
MIASVAAERRGIHLHAVSQVSIAHFSNSGPLSLGLLAPRGLAPDPVVRLVVALLILTTFASQFKSTLLVSDLELGRVRSFPRTVPNAYAVGEAPGWSVFDSDVTVSGDPWRHRARFAQTLAEYSREPAAAIEGTDDTGPTVRAFLPMSSQEARESLLEFRGRAWLMDSRVICMRPELRDVRLCQPSSLCGSVRLERSVAEAAGLGGIGKNDFYDFRCPIQAVFPPVQSLHYNFTEWDKIGGTVMELLWNVASMYWTPEAFMAGNLTMHNSKNHGPLMEYIFQGSGELDTQMELAFNMTICARFDQSEPAYAWDVNRGIFNTSAVRRQLGAVKDAVKDASSISSEDRQILSIDRAGFELGRGSQRWRAEGASMERANGSAVGDAILAQTPPALVVYLDGVGEVTVAKWRSRCFVDDFLITSKGSLKTCFAAKKQQIREELAAALTSIHLAFDLWTSPNGGESIGLALAAVARDWDITEWLGILVSDNASSNDRAVEALYA